MYHVEISDYVEKVKKVNAFQFFLQIILDSYLFLPVENQLCTKCYLNNVYVTENPWDFPSSDTKYAKVLEKGTTLIFPSLFSTILDFSKSDPNLTPRV